MLRRIWAVFLKDLEVFLYSPIMYVLWAVFLFFNSWAFVSVLNVLNSPSGAVQIYPVEVFFGGTIFFWLSLLVLVPLLTMRSVSEEIRTGSIELLFTTPLNEFEFVMGKFLAVNLVLAVFWISTLAYPFMLVGKIDLYWPAVWIAFLGVLLLNSAMSALGIFCSTMTANQVISGFLSFVLIAILFTIGIFQRFSIGVVSRILGYISLIEQFDPFSSGVLNLASVVYFVSFAVLFLFISTVSLAHRRQRL